MVELYFQIKHISNCPQKTFKMEYFNINLRGVVAKIGSSEAITDVLEFIFILSKPKIRAESAVFTINLCNWKQFLRATLDTRNLIA